jgi:hypothetical protein
MKRADPTRVREEAEIGTDMNKERTEPITFREGTD